jgi:hypothetical protein
LLATFTVDAEVEVVLEVAEVLLVRGVLILEVGIVGAGLVGGVGLVGLGAVLLLVEAARVFWTVAVAFVAAAFVAFVGAGVPGLAVAFVGPVALPAAFVVAELAGDFVAATGFATAAVVVAVFWTTAAGAVAVLVLMRLRSSLSNFLGTVSAVVSLPVSMLLSDDTGSG